MGRIVLVLMIVVALWGCSEVGPPPAEMAADKPVVLTVNYPLQYLGEWIAGDLATVRFPGPAGEDPAYWEPDAETLRQYQQADLILLNGAGYAKWTATASLPASKMVDTSAGFGDRLIEIESFGTHSHGPGGEHEHGGVAFTTWLDVSLAIQHAEAVAEALARLRPEDAAVLEENLAGLRRDLESVDAALRDAAGGSDAPVLGSHPVYQYLGRAYGLNLKELHWEPDEMPAEEEWRKLDELLREHPAKWMLWEAPPLAEIQEALEKRGVRVVVFYTVNNVPEEGDFLSVMQGNAERLAAAFGGEQE